MDTCPLPNSRPNHRPAHSSWKWWIWATASPSQGTGLLVASSITRVSSWTQFKHRVANYVGVQSHLSGRIVCCIATGVLCRTCTLNCMIAVVNYTVAEWWHHGIQCTALTSGSRPTVLRPWLVTLDISRSLCLPVGRTPTTSQQVSRCEV